MAMKYKLYDFSDIADALNKMRDDPRSEWTGPEYLHHSISATSHSPSWQFSEEGLAYHMERGRTFEDVLQLVTFQIGFHNGAVQADQYNETLYNLIDVYKKIIDDMRKEKNNEV